MGEAIKGSIKQYLQGLKDSSYGLLHIYQLDKKVVEQNKRKKQRFQEENMVRRYRGRFDARRPLHSAPSTSAVDPNMNIKSEPRLLGRIALSALMSSFIYTSIWGFNTFLVPLLRYQNEQFAFTTHEVNVPNAWDKTESVLQFLFSSLWVIPLYVISKVVNGFWFVDVSNAIYKHYRGQPQSFSSPGRMIADFIYSIFIETIFLLQAVLVKHIPFLTELSFMMFCIHHCLLYALYAFEYKWFNMGLDVRLRIQLVETHWPYFCGFGTPLFVLTSLTSSFYPTVVSACVFSLLFPFFIISATKAETPAEMPAVRLRIFEFSMSLCNAIFKSSVRSRQTVEQSNNRFYSSSNR